MNAKAWILGFDLTVFHWLGDGQILGCNVHIPHAPSMVYLHNIFAYVWVTFKKQSWYMFTSIPHMEHLGIDPVLMCLVAKILHARTKSDLIQKTCYLSGAFCQNMCILENHRHSDISTFWEIEKVELRSSKKAGMAILPHPTFPYANQMVL